MNKAHQRTIEKARMSLVGAACQYACAEDWLATWRNEETRGYIAALRDGQLERLQKAASHYLRAVCGESPNDSSSATDGSAARETLRSAWGYIDNALSGLVARGERASPLARDLIAAQALIEEVMRQNDPTGPKGLTQ